MLRIVGLVVVVLLAITGFYLWLSGTVHYEGAAASAAAAVALAEPFAATGTIDYTSDNAGNPAPYLVYKNAAGMTLTKALVFSANSSCETSRGNYPCRLIADDLNAYYGQSFVRAVGQEDASSLVVDSLTSA